MELIDEEKLIECVRGHECLYNHKLQNYKNATLKQEAWDQIAAELNTTTSLCKAKWNLLRNAFVHAVTRRKTVTGQGVKNLKKWKFEEEMSFLLPYMAHRNTVSNIGESEDSQNSDITINEYSNKENKYRKQKNACNYHEQILNVMKSRTGCKSEKDEIDLFFQTMATTVKKFPKVEQVKLKFSIMKMINDVEMRMLTESSSSSTTEISTPPPFIRLKSPYLRDHSASPSYFRQYSSSPQSPQRSPSPLDSSPLYVSQFIPSSQNAIPSPSSNRPSSSTSTVQAYTKTAPNTSKTFSTQQFSLPLPSNIHQQSILQTTENSAIDETASTNTSQDQSQQRSVIYEGPAKNLLEYLIIKKKPK